MKSVYSKIILSGEHAVLRGGMAIVAPYKKWSLNYDFYQDTSFNLSLSENVNPYEILIEGTINKALQILNKTTKDIPYNIEVNSIVPLGKGLGGSAALCVFVAKLFNGLGLINKAKLFSFSVELENMFHGESSGLDIAGCLSESCIKYYRGREPEKLKLQMPSSFYLALSELKESGSTEDCILKVLDLKNKNKSQFYELDEKMNESAKLMATGLESGNLNHLIESMNLGDDCFRQWGLYTQEMQVKHQELKSKGALAVKPTGSGMGGYMLSLWDREVEGFFKI